MRQRRIVDRDDGATLIIALVIITVVALVTGAVLAQTYTSLRSTEAIRDEAGAAYNGDGAGQIAVNALRRGDGFSGTAFDNAGNSSCFGPTTSQTTLALPDFYPATNGQNGSAKSSASVVCTAEPGTGAQGNLVPITDANKPGNAVLTLGTGGEDGINVKALAKDSKNVAVPFNVHGGIVSDSNINVSSGTLLSNTSVRAHTGCTGTIISTPPPVCNSATVADPGWQTEIQLNGLGVPTYQQVPTTCPGKLVTFNPGYYDDASALSNLMDGNGSCKGSVWWFRPGSYYFDFHNSGEAPVLPSSSDVWLIKDGQLVAGTPCAPRTFPDPVNDPNNPRCTVISTPTVPAVVPGACEYPTETTNSSAGVQFIFGGDSRLQLAGGDAEICGNYETNHVAPGLYGLESGTATTTALTGASALKLNGTQPAADFSNPANAMDVDASSATWVPIGATNGSPKSGTLTLQSYVPPSVIPAGSYLNSTANSSSVLVKHGNSAGLSTDTHTITITPKDAVGVAGSAITLPAPAYTDNVLHTDLIDLSGNSAFAQFVHSRGFSGATITYSATVKHSGTESVDAVQLNITYTAPAFRAESTPISGSSNCLITPYTGLGGGGCPVLSTQTNYSGAVYLEGTTYTPIAAVDVTLSNITQQVLRFGLVSRTLFIKETGALTYSGPVIILPDNSLGYGTAATIVDLSVYVCPGVTTSTCSTDGSRKLQLTARVLMYDPGGSYVAGSRQAKILSWSQQR